jgi:biopolymer transport protein TolR
LQVGDLASKLAAISDNKLDRRIFVRGDKGVPYGRIMEVMATITQSGFSKVALLAEQTAGTTPTAPVTTPVTAAPAAAATPSAAPSAPAVAPSTGARRPVR